MSSFLLLALPALFSAHLAASQSSQTTLATSQSGQTTLAAVVFTLHGDTTPQLTTPHPRLTPLGAQQAMLAGTAIRTRYISGPQDDITTSYPIAGISTTYLDDAQLSILASAQAFMQGLYPPVEGTQPGAMLADGSVVESPVLKGYQYPRIQTTSPVDFNHIWLAGADQCTRHSLASADYQLSADSTAISQSTFSFYQSLIPTLFHGIIPDSQVSYSNAHSLWDLAASASLHNATIASSLSPASLARLRALASHRANRIHANPSVPVSTISGQTLAGKVLALLSDPQHGLDGGVKLHLLFGSHAPFLAFAELARLGAEFRSLPRPGSVMAFELFSSDAAGKGELKVRFLFRNGTAEEAGMVAYPLFGRGRSEADMKWGEFEEGMAGVAVTGPGEWCEKCGSLAGFCEGFGRKMEGVEGKGNETVAGGETAQAQEQEWMMITAARFLWENAYLVPCLLIVLVNALGAFMSYREQRAHVIANERARARAMDRARAGDRAAPMDRARAMAAARSIDRTRTVARAPVVGNEAQYWIESGVRKANGEEEVLYRLSGTQGPDEVVSMHEEKLWDSAWDLAEAVAKEAVAGYNHGYWIEARVTKAKGEEEVVYKVVGR